LLIAREAQGSMRDAQSLLEQALSYAAPLEKKEEAPTEVDETLLEDILGIAPRKVLFEICASVIQGKPERCVELVAEVASNGLDLPRLSQELVEHFRNLMVARLMTDQGAGSATASMATGRLFDLHDQEIEELKAQARNLSLDNLMDYFRVMVKGDDEIARSSYPRFALETTLVRLATLPRSIAVAEALERLEQIERRLSGNGQPESPSPSKNTSPPLPVNESPVPIKSASPEVGPADSLAEQAPARGLPAEEANVKQWAAFVSFVMKKKKFLASHLQQARPLSLPPGKLRIGVEDRHQLAYLQDHDNLSALEGFARHFFSDEVSVTISPLAGESDAAGPPVASIEPQADPDSKDMIGETLRIFGGSIKEVKGKP
ncbi:MAG TPA: hypothetical protein VGB25_02200, partial [Candidatus Binatia bacterium]